MDTPGADIDAGEFRTGIRMAMRIGMPTNPDQWPAFVSLTGPTITSDVDVDGVPWDVDDEALEPTETVVNDALCALEWPPGTREAQEQWGALQPGQLRITLLDEEYAQIEGFTRVRVWPSPNGDPVEMLYRKVLGRHALGSVEVFTVLVASEDTV